MDGNHESLGYDRDAMKINGYDESRINILSFFNLLFKTIQYQDWFCGHYHIDKDLWSFHFMYQRVLNVETKENAGCMYPEYQSGDKVLFSTSDDKKPSIKGVIDYCYPCGTGKYRLGMPDYDIRCTDDIPFAKNVICKNIHEEWIVKDQEETL